MSNIEEQIEDIINNVRTGDSFVSPSPTKKDINKVKALIHQESIKRAIEELKMVPTYIKSNDIAGVTNPISDMSKMSLQDISMVMAERITQLEAELNKQEIGR